MLYEVITNALPGGKPPQFLSTHPDPENRQKALAKLVPQVESYYMEDRIRPVWPVESVTALD